MPIKWTPEKNNIVRTMYPNSTYKEIVAYIPGISSGALLAQAQKLGVKKSEEYLNTVTHVGIARSVKTRKGKSSWNKQVHPEIVCQGCGTVFTVQPCRKDKAKYCSQRCMGKHFTDTKRFVGENNPKYQDINHTCERCGKVFHVNAFYHERGVYRYCSNACKYPAKVEINCKWCNKPFMVRPLQKERGRKQFCSQACHGCYTVTTIQKGATSIEIAVEQVLIALNEPYKSQKQMGPYITDFYLPQYKLILECDGDYWHSLPNVVEKDKKKDHWLYAHNYKLLRLSEKDIKADAMKAVCEGLQRVVHDFTPPSTLAQLALWT